MRSTITSSRPLGHAALLLALGLMVGCQSGPGRPADDPNWFVELFPAFEATPTPGEAARNAFNVYSPDRRRQGVDQLAAAPFGDEPVYVRMYRLLLDDPDASVRAACAKALGRHGEVEDVTRLTPLLRDESPIVRWETAKALQRLHHRSAAGPLTAALQNDDDPDVRQAAATALGQYPTPAVFHALVGALHDTEYSVAWAARRSLRTLTGEDLGPEAADWLAWSEQQRGAEALFAGRQRYTYEPWSQPPTFIQRLKPWPGRSDPEARTPVGLDDADRG